ncbi:MAG: glucose-6-phosphate isomerase [bacterium]
MSSLLTEESYDRFWKRDGSLWSSDPAVQEFIHSFMGWTDIAERMQAQVPDLVAFAEQVKADGFTDVLVCGMGGSSLGSLVLRDVFGGSSSLRVHVLDSTSPGTVLRFRRELPLATTLFLVASKSGATVEPKAFEDYFWKEANEELGDKAKQHFVAITDPGSMMEKQSKERGYRRIFLGDPEIGGRFSVLSIFGLVTASLLGVNLEDFLANAIAKSQSAAVDGEGHPGFTFGTWLSDNALAGREKVTLFTSPGLESFGLWAEQLVAESTGKGGQGVLPVAMEPVKQLDQYGDDRVFVGLRYDDSRGAQVTKLGQAMEALGHPYIERVLTSELDLAGEMFVWEVATAVAGAGLQLNPFDQPNVESAKVLARKKLGEITQGDSKGLTGGFASGGCTFYGAAGLGEFLSEAPANPYVAFLAYLDEDEATNAFFDQLRLGIPYVTSFGYGPRYLHSTGQYHKGGPDNGLFVLILGEDKQDVKIPGMGVTFGQLKRAQAIGDMEALQAEGRPVLLVTTRQLSDLTALLD